MRASSPKVWYAQGKVDEREKNSEYLRCGQPIGSGSVGVSLRKHPDEEFKIYDKL